MSWDYRIIKLADGSYALHEVFYDGNAEPVHIICEPVEFTCGRHSSPEAIIESLRLAAISAAREVIDGKEFWK